MGGTHGELGEFLRARRSLVRPEQVGLSAGDERRVPGLRREEVAALASVSTDYYVQLEQGREGRPSAQVLDALARVLRLDDDAHAHVRSLAGHPASSAPAETPVTTADPRRRALVDLIDHGVSTPAMLVTPWLEVVARNRAADVLYEGLALRDNLARMVFLDPGIADLVPDIEDLTRCTAATLRAAAGPEPHEPRTTALVDELTRRSETFARLWPRHDVHRKKRAVKYFDHGRAGPLVLTQHVLALPEDPDLQVWLYQPEPGSATEDALARLLGTRTEPAAR